MRDLKNLVSIRIKKDLKFSRLIENHAKPKTEINEYVDAESDIFWRFGKRDQISSGHAAATYSGKIKKTP